MREWESYFWEWDLWQQEFVLIHSRPSPAYLAICVKSSSRKNWPAVFFTCFPFPFIRAHICFCARVTSASRIFLGAHSWFFFKRILSRISFSHRCFHKAHSISAVKWLDVSVLLPKNASVFDCAPTGMPHLQGLASYPCLLGFFFLFIVFLGGFGACASPYTTCEEGLFGPSRETCADLYCDFCVNGANSTERTLSQTDVMGKSRQRVCRSSYFI